MSKAKAATKAVAVQIIAPTMKPTDKLERLSVREKVKKALGLPDRFSIISREAGHIDIYVPVSQYTEQALRQAVTNYCQSNGIGCEVLSSATKDQAVTLRFTNSLMKAQAFWGARENSRQDRVLADHAANPVAATPAAKAVPAAKAGDQAPQVKPAAKAGQRKQAKAK